ncbi:hypothetical protein K439DRAFT_1663414 [Ramaria rubella]|nr:hypothetical protein K439DRAFT_1663414 [Ramaria rubella]
MPSACIDDIIIDQSISKLSKSLEKLRLSSSRPDLQNLWMPQIKRFRTVHPNAVDLLAQVPIPHTLTNARRIHAFVHSTSITQAGKAYPPQPSEIFPGRLWIADHFSGTDHFTLHQLGITHSICIGHSQYHQGCPCLHFAVHMPIVVPQDLYDAPVGVVDDTVTFIQDVIRASPSYRILIHCAMGSNWSAGIAMACVMDFTGYSFNVAHDIVKSKREAVHLEEMVAEAIQQWWALEQLRANLPVGRGYRAFKWTAKESSDAL